MRSAARALADGTGDEVVGAVALHAIASAMARVEKMRRTADDANGARLPSRVLRLDFRYGAFDSRPRE